MATAQDIYITYAAAAQAVKDLEQERAGLGGTLHAAAARGDQQAVSRLIARQHMIPVLLDQARADLVRATGPKLALDDERAAATQQDAEAALASAAAVLKDAQEAHDRALAAVRQVGQERQRIRMLQRDARRALDALDAAAAPTVGVA